MKRFTFYPNPNWWQRIHNYVFPVKIEIKKDPRTIGIPEDVARDIAKMMTFDVEKGLIGCPPNMSTRLVQAGTAYWEANEGIEYTFRSVTSKKI